MNVKDIPEGDWIDDMLRCPSQCYRRETVNGVDYVLYLRWRWEDPWQAHIVRCNGDKLTGDETGWTKDIFFSLGHDWIENDVQSAKEDIEAMFEAIKPLLEKSE